jgi:hypothetical protein
MGGWWLTWQQQIKGCAQIYLFYVMHLISYFKGRKNTANTENKVIIKVYGTRNGHERYYITN